MIYAPDDTNDNAELRKIASAAFQTRIHQCGLNEFRAFEEASKAVAEWYGWKIDLLFQEYFDRQAWQLNFVRQGTRLEDTFYAETRLRAISYFSDLAKRGALSTMQCRMFDAILQAKPQ